MALHCIGGKLWPEVSYLQVSSVLQSADPHNELLECWESLECILLTQQQPLGFANVLLRHTEIAVKIAGHEQRVDACWQLV